MLLLVLIFTAAAILVPAIAARNGKSWARRWLRLLWAARNEWLAVPMAALLFFASGFVLRAMDPQAGLFDLGVLQGLFVSAIQLFTAMTTAQVATGISYRRIFKLPKTEPVCPLEYAALYALYLLACVVLMAAL